MGLLVFAVLAIAAVSGNDEPRKCKPGYQIEFLMSTFQCREDGSGYDYIAKEHSGGIFLRAVPKVEVRCVPGRTWLNDDKICVCPNDASRSICTNTVGSKELDLSSRICHPGNSIPRASSTKDAKICNPGDIFWAKLNICACTSDGSGWICANSVDSGELQLSATTISHRNNSTYIAAGTERQMECTPGDVVVDDNAICTCVNDGKGRICAITVASQSLHLSSKICHRTKNWNSSPSADDGNLCNAGDSFVLHNEMCVCVSDRTSWICYNTVGTEKLHISSKISQRNDWSSGVASESQVGCSPGVCYTDGNTVCCCVSDGSGWLCGNTAGSEMLHLTLKTGNCKDSITSGAATEEQLGCSPGDCYTDGNILCCCVKDGSGWVCGRTVGSQNFKLTRKSVDAEKPISGLSAKDVESCNSGDAVVDGRQICVCGSDGSGWICTRTIGSDKLHLFLKSGNRNDSMTSGSPTEGQLGCTAGACYTNGNIVCCCTSDGSGWICGKAVGSEKLHLTAKTGNRNGSMTSNSPTKGQVGCSPGDCYTNGKILCCCVSDGSGWLCGETVGSEMLYLTSKTGNRKDSTTSGAATEGQLGCSPGDCYTDGNILCCCVKDGSGWVCGRTVDSQNFNLTRKSVDAEKPISGPSAKDVESCNPGDAVVDGHQICVCGSDGSGWICTRTVGSDKLHLFLKTGNRNDSMTTGSPTEGQLGCTAGACYTNGNIVCCCTSDGSGWICGKAVGSEKLHLTAKTGNRNGSMTSKSPTEGQVGCSPGDCYTNGKILCCCVSDGSGWLCGETAGSELLHLTSKTGNRKDSMTSGAATEGQLGCTAGACYTNGNIVCCCTSDGSGWICGKAVGSEKLHLTAKTGNRNGSMTSKSPTEGQVGCSAGDCYTEGNILCCCASDGSGFICTNAVGSNKLYPSSAATDDPPCAPGDVVFDNGVACVCDTNGVDRVCLQADGPGRIRVLNPFARLGRKSLEPRVTRQ